ncbi:uncharacterized transmembrane protein DDB_G0289901-like [Battus philenor]|uniref:uncharacterized transmembrane protein DDB_G0289901-like n=1 Tax=Battus philenor TaxID=42288 RepID=UPI0035CEB342
MLILKARYSAFGSIIMNLQKIIYHHFLVCAVKVAEFGAIAEIGWVNLYLARVHHEFAGQATRARRRASARQSEPTSRPDGMRGAPQAARALAPLHALLLTLFIAFVAARVPVRYQTYYLCQDPDSFVCEAWHESRSRGDWISEGDVLCGHVRDLSSITPPTHYSIVTLDGEEIQIYCRNVIISIEENKEVVRGRRQVGVAPRGRYRGQTQSQYLAIDHGGKEEGKAEAHSAADSSRASVSGNSGMGQAQSQSIYDPTCDDCYGKTELDAANFKKRPYGSNTGQNEYGPDQNVGSGWSAQPNGPIGSTYGNNQNAGPGPNGYGQNQPGAQNFGHRYGAPGGDSSYSPGGTVGQGPSGNGLGSGPGGSTVGTVPGKGADSLTPGGSRLEPGVANVYGPIQHGSGPNARNEPIGGVRPDHGGMLGNRYGPVQGGDAGHYGPGRTGTPESGSYPPGSLLNAPNGESYPPGSFVNAPGSVSYPPGNIANAPGSVSYSPGSLANAPGSVIYPPGSLTNAPGSVSYPPGSLTNAPGSGSYPPGSLTNAPGSVSYPPGSLTNAPGSGSYPPGSLTNAPGSVSYPPGSLTNAPGSGSYPPGSLTNAPGTVSYPPGSLTNAPGSGSYPPGSLTNAPGSVSYPPGNLNAPGSGFGPGQLGTDGRLRPGQIGYGTGSNLPPVYGTGQNNVYIPGGGPSPSGSRNAFPVGQGPVINNGVYNNKQPGIPDGTGGSNQSRGPGGAYNPDQVNTVGGRGLNPSQGGNWPGLQYTSGNSPYFCCVVGPDGNLMPTGGSPYRPNINSQYPDANNQLGYGGQVGVPTGVQGPYGAGSPGNGMNVLGQGVGDNLGTGRGNENYGTNTGRYPGGGAIYGPGQIGQPGQGNYNPGQDGGFGNGRGYRPADGTGSYVSGPNVRGPVGGSYIPETGSYGADQKGMPNVGSNYAPGGVGGSNGANRPGQNLGVSYSPGSFAPGSVGYNPSLTGRGTENNFGPGQIIGPSDGNRYGSTQGGGPGASRNFSPDYSGGTSGNGNYAPGSGYIPGQPYGPGVVPNYGSNGIIGPGGVGSGNGATGENYGPVRSGSYGPGQTDARYGSDPNSGNYGPGPSSGREGNIGPRFGSGPGADGNVQPGGSSYGNYGPVQNGETRNYSPDDGNNMVNYGQGGRLIPGQNNGEYFPHQGAVPGSQGTYGSGQPGIYNQNHGGIPGQNYGSAGRPDDGRFGGSPVGNGYDQRFMGQNNDYNGVPQNFTDPNTLADGDDSEAEASVSQAANGTTASATSRGGNDKGRAQTSVHGTYTGSGSFSAQAQITGENKEAESEVTGGKKGASSSAQGSGRNNKSQANVQLGSETGSVQTQSLTNGAYHSSNSQVQGSVKGGMADAQARGPGSTSSQAQIGFTPYKDGDKSHDLQKVPFVGGGLASAQSSGRSGQSQSQLHGTFKYGITYNGAAQSGASINKDEVFPNRLSFDKIDVFDEKEKNINVETETPAEVETSTPVNTTPHVENVPTEESLQSEDEDPTESSIAENTGDEENRGDETLKNSESRYSSHTHLDHHKSENPDQEEVQSPPASAGSTRSFQSNYGNNGAEYEYTTDREDVQPDEYDSEGPDSEVQGEYSNYDEVPRDTLTHQSLQSPRSSLNVRQTTGGNTQHIVLGALNNHDAEITQRNSERPDESRTYQPGERVPGTGGFTIPAGFTGSVQSVASKEKTYVVGSKESPSQAQTVTLTPGSGRVKYSYPSYGRVEGSKLRSLSTPARDDRYVSVSKSVTRDLDAENNVRKQYSHSYYTKSSSCGFFTFTCTMVSGADGKKKVCRPKIPRNPDGTPIRC